MTNPSEKVKVNYLLRYRMNKLNGNEDCMFALGTSVYYNSVISKIEMIEMEKLLISGFATYSYFFLLFC